MLACLTIICDIGLQGVEAIFVGECPGICADDIDFNVLLHKVCQDGLLFFFLNLRFMQRLVPGAKAQPEQHC